MCPFRKYPLGGGEPSFLSGQGLYGPFAGRSRVTPIILTAAEPLARGGGLKPDFLLEIGGDGLSFSLPGSTGGQPARLTNRLREPLVHAGHSTPQQSSGARWFRLPG